MPGSTTNAAFSEYIYFDGKRAARRDYQSNVFYYFADQVGSARGMFEVASGSHTATPCFDADFYPFGGEHDFLNSCPQNYKFMGKERDPETNNDDFGARSYASAYGRFLSADWSSTPTPVPYANLTNPQTLNLYAMVSDNPESFADLDGHGTDTQSNTGTCATGTSESCGAQQAAAQNSGTAQVRCTNEDCTTATQTVVVRPKPSFWNRFKSWFSGGDSDGFGAGLFPRLSAAQMRSIWENFYGRAFPKNPMTGRNLDATHVRALADNGNNSPENIRPMDHAEHMRMHKENGDFVRWARRASLRREFGEELGEQMYNEIYGQIIGPINQTDDDDEIIDPELP